MGPRIEGTSLDRIDKDGNYEPGNVRWADKYTQARNKRTNRILKFQGRHGTVAEWARATGLHVMTIHRRLNRGWTIEQALTTIPGMRKAA